MTGIVNGIQKLVNIIVTLKDGMIMAINFLINQIKSIIEMFMLITRTVVNLGALVGTLPTWLVAVATCTLSVSVLYVILGRNTGK